VAGTLNSSILVTLYLSETEFYKNNTKFKRKRGGRAGIQNFSLSVEKYFTSERSE